MNRSGISILGRAAALLCLGIASAQADAPQMAICAIEQSIACPPFEPCERSLPASVNLPVLLKIDRTAGVILSRRESGEERTSVIGTDTGDDAVHVLQGSEDGKPWSMRVDIETGRFTLTSAQPDAGYLAFGLCSSSILK